MLRKSFEKKVIALRLSEIAMKTRLVSPIHFGAIARRLAVDAAATLTHNVEKVWQDSEIFTVLAFDIRGAFDTIMTKRLSTRFWE